MSRVSSISHGRRIFMALTAMLLTFVLVSATFAAQSTVNVQILSINDLHGNLLPKGNSGGVAYLATYLQEREAANPNTLVVHAGDVIGGSPVISALLQDEPTMEVLQFLGMDVGVPGNHAFDEGINELLRLQRGGRHQVTGFWPGSGFPLVCANVVDKVTQDPVLPPYVIKSVGGVPVGFIGVISLETPTIVLPLGVASLSFTDPVAAVNKYAEVLKSKGVETIVVLAHEGGTQNAAGEITGAIRSIAEQTDKAVDVIVSGHSHTVLNGKVAGKLIVQTGSNGANFSDVDLVIDKATGDVVSSSAEIVKVVTDGKTPDPWVSRLVDGYNAKVKPLQDRVIGEITGALTRSANAAGESPLGDFIADSQRTITGTQIAFMNSGGIRADLPAGIITWGALYTVQPFGNNLVTMTLTGDQIRRVLNQQWQQSGTVRIMAVSGLKYSWDSTKAIGERVVDIWLEDGTAINPSAKYTVAGNYFIATGGDGFTVFTEAKDQVTSMVDLDAAVEYVKGLKKPFSYSLVGRITKLK